MKSALHMVLAMFWFSIMQVGVKLLSDFPPVQLVLARAVVTLVMCAWMLKRLNLSFLGEQKGFLILRGASGAVALVAYFYAIQKLSLGTAVTVQYLSPIFATLIARVFFHERPALRQWVFLACAFAGVWMIKSGSEVSQWWPLVAVVFSAIFSGLAYNCVRVLTKTESEYLIVMYFSIVTLPIVGPLAIWNWVQPSHYWQWLILLGIGVATQFAQISMTRAYSLAQVSYAAIYKYFGVVFALFFGWLIFDEWLTLWSGLGIALIIVPSILNIFWKQFKQEK